jgi:hypothetical protein
MLFLDTRFRWHSQKQARKKLNSLNAYTVDTTFVLENGTSGKPKIISKKVEQYLSLSNNTPTFDNVSVGENLKK